MTEKITVTREVAEALAECERNYISTDITLLLHAQRGLTGKYAPLQTLTIGDLAAAMINGYEVEKTPEEMVREYYGEYDGTYGDIYRRRGIRTTLDMLGIKVEGVNA
ncbi:hypothetical protein [Sporosarcina koreensis]|uniref:hypothetical protein n=1 Tax=Sporosarcina koreensis TaxID=334735 RepID=UPI00075C557B|nr:hypothetical protein [Sporosarcina koreensis]